MQKIELKIYLLTFLVLIQVIFSGCQRNYEYIQNIDQPEQIIPSSLFQSLQDLPSSQHIPYEDKVIRMYFHFFNNVDSTLNFNRDEAGSVVYELLENANKWMEKNDKMNLPIGNKTVVKKSHIRYKLHNYDGEPGIFYHYDKEPRFFIKKGKKSNLYDRKIINEFAVKPDSVLNVFVMPFDPEQLKSGVQKKQRTAIALGTTIKLPGIYQKGIPPWQYTGIFNHEVGHVLGLRHSWNSNDGCDDTPLNDNCWVTTEDPPCDSITSNNLMDYNAYQSALTPCQIARMQATLANPGKAASKLVVPDGCQHLGKEYIITSEEKWSQPVRLSGDLIIEKYGILYLKSLLQMANDSKISIKKGGTLVLENASIYNSCGMSWKGIFKHPKAHFYLIGQNNRLINLEDDSNALDSLEH